MSIVTIRGQLGSGAPEIGKQVAERIHADYVDREVIAQVAERLQAKQEEVIAREMPPGGLWGRIAEALGRSYIADLGFGGAYLPAWQIPVGDIRYLQALESVVRDLASIQPIVIRGRGSQFILRDHPEAFHVLVVAPVELRVKRVMHDLRVEEKTARHEVERFDSSRHEFVKRYFEAEMEDPVHYGLVINTERFSFDIATSIIVDALRLKGEELGRRAEE
ncbi:MAG: cytidylate kinase-like family protein [Dehalococcoidia bacterium]|nr:cytidylate kinase-like family protein [Dehalococcoidia bacterium]